MVVQQDSIEPSGSLGKGEIDKFEDFFLFLNKSLGIDHKKIVKSYTDIQKMAWEQVLLLTIYSRQYCYNPAINEDCASFISRMKLIENAYWICHEINKDKEDNPDYGLLELVLGMLDNHNGSMAISKKLWEEASGSDESWSKACNALLTSIERSSISFSFGFMSSQQHYSHYAMYIALRQPISLFQPLLNIEDISDNELFYKRFMDSVRNYIINKFRNPVRYIKGNTESDEIRDAFDDVDSLQSLKDFIETYPEAIDKSELMERLKADVMMGLCHHVQNSFQCTKPPKFEKRSYFVNNNVFGEVCKLKRSDDNLTLDLDGSTLRNLIQLGLIDEVVKEIKATLLNATTGTGRGMHRPLIQVKEYGKAFDELCAWYQFCKTDLFNKLEQVPRLVASVIALDIKHRQGFFSDELAGIELDRLPKKLKADQIAQITTSIIHHCLYKDVPYHLLTEIALSSKGRFHIGIREDDKLDDMLSKASEYIQDRGWSLEDSSGAFCESPNKMMVEWQSFSKVQTAVERLKKVPNYLNTSKKKDKKHLTTLSMVTTQRKKGVSGKVPYPINTQFPLPLWASLDKYLIADKEQNNT